MTFLVVNTFDRAVKARKSLGGLPLLVKPTFSTKPPKRVETVAAFEQEVRSALRRSPKGQAWIETVKP